MFIAPARLIVQPSYFAPEKILKFNQRSGAFEMLHGGAPETRLGEGDLAVYIGTLDVRTKTAAGQNAYEQLPSADIVADYISTPTYLMRTRAEWNHHDSAAASRWGVSIDTAQRLAMRMGIFQQMRNNLLYGMNPSNGEGLVNSPGATTTNLPADSNGNTTFITYDNGQMALFFLSVVVGIKTRTFQYGQPSHVVITAPQRILGQMETENVVQLTQYQRSGAGVATTMGMVREVLAMAGDTVEFAYDDTLIGQGAGGNDLVMVTIPSVKDPTGNRKGVGAIDTGEFNKLMPSMEACNVMFVDMVAPREIRAPLPAGAVDVVSELRGTSGWNVRPEALTLVSMQYQ
jgi:hypothetical protein